MPQRLDASAAGFAGRFAAFLDAKRDTEAAADRAAADIVQAVRAKGDEALFAYTERFDRFPVGPDTVRIRPEEMAAAFAGTPPAQREALELAAERIRAFHEAQRPQDLDWTDAAGVRLGLRWTPLDSVGVYVPGGTAAYPSSVLMNAVPARVAGVSRIAMAVPTPDNRLNPLVLAAAHIAGVDEAYRIGGAQAVAALAYGTDSVPAVDKIVGPGNAYVAAAKRLVFGRVGIDTIAGPSEVLIVAEDGQAPAEWLAADLLAQAEHDTAAQSILVSDSADLLDRVEAAVTATLATLPRGEIAAASWRDHGALILVPGLAAALPLVDAIAPEHLQLVLADADGFAARVRHAGAIFLGAHTPEAVGDYVGGPNHVLPTDRSARFASGLSLYDFLKRTTLLGCDGPALGRIGPAAVTLAEAEGLGAHALSVALRLGRG
ncbi:MAG: histidinol dehydrogenase [Alphaproteobacteria bacterium]|nr:histidinol dehydrogenase [Alphaproteobacteria bacterium]MCB9928099.1 histidinol dehydrogenase [Alphaproteobacteria bacterium]